jgi:hypothetical protein
VVEYAAFAADSLGNLFVGGAGLDANYNYNGTFIREASGPAPASTLLTGTSSSTEIAFSSLRSDDTTSSDQQLQSLLG